MSETDPAAEGTEGIISITTSINDVEIHLHHLTPGCTLDFFLTRDCDKSNTPKVSPIHFQEFAVKQSEYDVCWKLHMRSIILDPPGTAQFSLSKRIEVDTTWGPATKINT